MGDPQPPQLPAKAPQGLKDFIDCKVQAVTIAKGKVDWLDLGDDVPDSDLSFEPGDAPGSAKIGIGVFGLTVVSVPASVDANGQLVVDTSVLSGVNIDAIKNAKDALDKAVRDLNDWLKYKGKKFGPPVIKNGGITLTKVPIAPPAHATPPPPPPEPVTPPPTPPPAGPGVAPPPADKGDDKGVNKTGCFLLSLLLLGVLGGGAIVVQNLTPGPTAAPAPTAAPTPFAVTPPSGPSAPTPLPITPPPGPSTPFPITPPPTAVTPPPSPPPVVPTPSPSPAACTGGGGFVTPPRLVGGLHAAGAAGACPPLGMDQFTNLLRANGLLTNITDTELVPALMPDAIDDLYAPDGKPSGFKPPQADITWGMGVVESIDSTAASLYTSLCSDLTPAPGVEVICGRSMKVTGPTTIVWVDLASAAPLPAPAGITFFLNTDADGKATNNFKPSAAFPLDVKAGADHEYLTYVLKAGQPMHFEVTNLDGSFNNFHALAGAQITGPGWVGWIVDGAPAKVEPGLYAVDGLGSSTAAHVGVDVPGRVSVGQPFPYFAPMKLP